MEHAVPPDNAPVDCVLSFLDSKSLSRLAQVANNISRQFLQDTLLHIAPVAKQRVVQLVPTADTEASPERRPWAWLELLGEIERWSRYRIACNGDFASDATLFERCTRLRALEDAAAEFIGRDSL
jgi:hypothetical protein